MPRDNVRSLLSHMAGAQGRGGGERRGGGRVSVRPRARSQRLSAHTHAAASPPPPTPCTRARAATAFSNNRLPFPPRLLCGGAARTWILRAGHSSGPPPVYPPPRVDGTSPLPPRRAAHVIRRYVDAPAGAVGGGGWRGWGWGGAGGAFRRGSSGLRGKGQRARPGVSHRHANDDLSSEAERARSRSACGRVLSRLLPWRVWRALQPRLRETPPIPLSPAPPRRSRCRFSRRQRKQHAAPPRACLEPSGARRRVAGGRVGSGVRERDAPARSARPPGRTTAAARRRRGRLLPASAQAGSSGCNEVRVMAAAASEGAAAAHRRLAGVEACARETARPDLPRVRHQQCPSPLLHAGRQALVA